MDLSSLSNVTTTATGLSNLILVSPQKTIGYQPQNPPNSDGSPSQAAQPPAILFHYEGDQKAVLRNEITDHFIEDNTAIQDQITRRPIIITTAGFIGEVNDIAPAILAPLQVLANKLTTIGAYTPSLSATAILAYNEAAFLYATAQQAINAAVSTWGSISGTGGESVISGTGIQPFANQNKQQQAFQQFFGYMQKNTLFTIQTPWAVFTDMAIESLEAIQGEETIVITDFNVTFKQMRFASTTVLGGSLLNGNLPGNVLSQSGRLASQATLSTDFGTTPTGGDTAFDTSGPFVSGEAATEIPQ